LFKITARRFYGKIAKRGFLLKHQENKESKQEDKEIGNVGEGISGVIELISGLS